MNKVKPRIHRTQLHLDEARYAVLANRAKREGKSIAQVVRDLIDEDLMRRESSRRKDSLDNIIGIFKGDGAAVAEHVDDYLYGDKA